MMWLPVHYAVASLLAGAAASAASPKRACGPITLAANVASLAFGLTAFIQGFPSRLFGVPASTDPISRVTLLLVLVLAALCAAYSTFRVGVEDPRARRYYVLYNLLAASMLLVAAVRNLLALYVFLEAVTFAAVPLIAHRGDAEAVEAAVKYLFVCASCSALSLLGMGVLISEVHTLDLSSLSQVLSGASLGSLEAKLCVYAMLVGFGVKVGVVGLHFFIIDAYGEAPSPIAPLIHVAGNYAVVRVLTAVHPLMLPRDQTVVMVVGLLTIYVGALLALSSRDVKRLAACVAVEGSGFIILSSSLGTAQALTAAVLCLVNFGLMETALFLSAGVVHSQTGTRSIGRLGGIFKSMPVTTWLFVSSALAVSGVPPFGGFVAELSVYRACLEACGLLAPLAAAVGSGILLASVVWAAHRMFFGAPREAGEVREPVELLAPVVVLFLLFTLLGVYPAPLLRLLGGV